MARVFHEIGLKKTGSYVHALNEYARLVAFNSSATENRATQYLEVVKDFVNFIEGWYYRHLCP